MMKKILLSWLFLLFSFNSFAASPDDLLKPDVAFKPSLSLSAPDKLKATWDIADGYYMYRKRFSLKSDTAGVTLGEPVFTKGKMKDDPGFGEVEVYRDQMSIEIPIIRDASVSVATLFKVKTKSQGCADIGVCYPPQKKTLDIQLAALSANNPEQEPVATSSNVINKTSSLAATLGITGLNDANAPLHPDKAFAYDVTAKNKQNLNARWDITEGHYLYQHKIKFSLIDPPAGISLGKPVLPEGKAEHDQYFGDIVTYNKSFDVSVPVVGDTASIDSLQVKASYQGCSKLTGICYPPQHKIQTVNLAKAPSSASSTTTTSTAPASVSSDTATNKVSGSAPAKALTDTSTSTNSAPPVAATKVSEQDSIVKNMVSGNFLTIIFSFFLAGIALTFTPCVFPMIPILSGIIAGQGSNNSTRKSFFLSLAYVLAMAFTYAVVGVIAALSGENLQVALQNPWVIGAFAGLFVLLSLAMFGFYELQMPAGIQNKLASISNSQSGGSMVNAAVMGLLSALIVGPCVTAPLIGALIYISQTNDVVIGGLSLFALGLGMGVPLMIIGTSAGKFLPKAGAWMDSVKAGFGIMMLALAIWMLDRILPSSIIVLLSGILAIFTGIYMGALDALNEASTGWKRFFKASGLVVLLYGAMLLFGAASGNGSLLQPLKGSFSGNNTAGSTQQSNSEQGLIFQQIKGIDGLDKALTSAKQQGKTVMLDFYADWCISCKEMEHGTFMDSKVIASLKDTVLLQADVTPNDDLDKALLKKFGLFGPPGILFFDKSSQENLPYRIVGEMKAAPFNEHVQQFLATIK